MNYNTDYAHCTAHDDNGFCPLLDCHRYWLHSELIRLRNDPDAKLGNRPIPYVIPEYKQGHCPNYIKHQST